MKPHVLLLFSLAMVIASGCDRGPKSSYGFTLPEGNAKSGREVFVSYTCHECHTVSGEQLPELDFAAEKKHAIGGEVTRIQTYGELVTSIVNPSHRLAQGYKSPATDDEEAVAGDGDTEATDQKPESTMTNYNDVMTVADLVDLVAFLQSKYTLKPYEPSPYDVYYYGP